MRSIDSTPIWRCAPIGAALSCFVFFFFWTEMLRFGFGAGDGKRKRKNCPVGRHWYRRRSLSGTIRYQLLRSLSNADDSTAGTITRPLGEPSFSVEEKKQRRVITVKTLWFNKTITIAALIASTWLDGDECPGANHEKCFLRRRPIRLCSSLGPASLKARCGWVRVSRCRLASVFFTSIWLVGGATCAARNGGYDCLSCWLGQARANPDRHCASGRHFALLVEASRKGNRSWLSIDGHTKRVDLTPTKS